VWVADFRERPEKIKTVPIGMGDLVNLETFYADGNLIVTITPLMWQLKALHTIGACVRL
jgi:hypothetical protein